jgi:hypothetical protein
VGHILRVVLIVVLLCFVVPCAWADNLDIVSQYKVNGLLTITGNSACGPLPACAETLAFSFVVGEVFNLAEPFTPGYTAYIIPGSGTVGSLGPLGQFSLLTAGLPGNLSVGGCSSVGLESPDCNYLAFDNLAFDEIDIHLNYGTSPTPFIPSVISTDLFACRSATCTADLDTTGTITNIFNFGEVEATVTAVPEASVIVLFAWGALGLLFLKNTLPRISSSL